MSTAPAWRTGWESAVAMPSGLFHIVPPAVFHAFARRFVHVTPDPSRRPNDQRAGRHFHVLQHECPGSDDRTSTDSRAVEHDRSHADQAIVLDGAAVQDDAMADGYPTSHRARNPLVRVDHREILDVGLRTDRDP